MICPPCSLPCLNTAKWSTATTFVNAVVSTILVAVLYNALRPVLLKSGMLQIVRKTEEVKI